MKIFIQAICISLFLSVAAAQDNVPPTAWTSSDGKTIKAAFVKIEGEAVLLKVEGKVVSVPLTRLSPASQAEARRLAADPQSASPVSPGAGGPMDIVFPTATFSKATVAEAVRFFSDKSRDLDPQRRGLVIHADAAALASKAEVTLDLRNVTLAAALKCLGLLASLEMTLDAGELHITTAAANRPPPAALKPSKPVAALGTLILPSLMFNGASLDEAAEIFRVKSRELSPDKETMPIVVGPPPAAGKYGFITLDLKNVRLDEALSRAAGLAGADVVCLGEVLYLMPKGAPVAPAPAASNEALFPELRTLDSQFQQQLAKEITAPHAEAVAQLDKSYLRALDDAIKTNPYYKTKLLEEKKHVSEGAPMPATVENGGDNLLLSMRFKYSSALAKLELDRTKNFRSFYPAWVTKLSDLESSLTRKSRTEDAKAVKSYREALVQQGQQSSPGEIGKMRRFVEDVVFGHLRTSVRWPQAPRLVLHSSDPELKAFVEAAYAEMCQAANLSTTGGMDLSVYIGTTGELLMNEGLKAKKIGALGDHRYYWWTNYDSNFSDFVIALCTDRLAGAAAKDALLKDLFHGFGVVGETSEALQSCMSTKGGFKTELTALDRKLLGFVYGHMPAGTKKTDVRKLADAYWNQ